MKLLNKSIFWLSIILFFIIGIWSVVFYFNILDEIKESVDENLDNYKRQIIYQAQRDSNILEKNNFNNGFFTIHQISKEQALIVKDVYSDSLLFMQDNDDDLPELEPVRLFTTAFNIKDKFYKLQIIKSMVEEDDLGEEIFLEAIILYLILIATIITINNFVLKHLWKPFYSLLHQLKNYKIGTSKELPVSSTNTKEFIDLENAINILLHQNVNIFEQQKQFIGNASHELQTPLAIIINKLELLLENGNLDEYQVEKISEIMNISERLVRLNKSLLLLTKIENKQILDNSPFILNKIVQQTLIDLEETINFKKIKISFKQTDDILVNMNFSLANILVSNLIRNSIFHNIPNGEVKIEITNNKLIILNTGELDQLDSKKIFSRFYKSDNNQNNTGLGLSIVKAICDLYGFSVTYYFENKFHCFNIQLK